MKKGIITLVAVAVLSLTSGAVAANTIQRLDPWKGWLSKTGVEYVVPSQWKKVEIFEDRNGCQYLVATGGSGYDYAAYGISITPRINSGTRLPYCT